MLTLVALSALLLGGVATAVTPPTKPSDALGQPRLTLEPAATMTVPGVGAGQGVFVHRGFVYLFGDAETGVIREFTWSPEARYELTPTGRDIVLTRDGVDIAPHPTGLTYHPDFGYLLGDTVRQTGIIFHIDFDRALADGNLDQAVLNTTIDDLAVNGTRPEFVTLGGEVLVATADYGDVDNEVRLYRPAALLKASRTSGEGVLAEAWPAGAFVQSLRWLPGDAESGGEGTLVLVQNMTAGQGYRLTPTVLGTRDDLRDFPPYDMAETQRELEGFAPLPFPGAPAILFSAYAEQNVTFAEISFEP